LETIDELIASNRLGSAVERLAAEGRARPRDPAPRLGLFTLLAFAGELDRAGKQLEVLEGLGAAGPDAARRRFLLGAERQRAALLAGDVPPPAPDDSAGAVATAFNAWRQARDGDAEGAAAILAAIDDRRPSRSGRLAGTPFDDLVDADDLLRPVLEAFTPDGYAWVPWDAVQYLAVSPPRDLLDILWSPAKLATRGGTIGVVAIPGLYPGSHAHADDAVRLGRGTAWADLGAGLARGAGAKLYVVDWQGRTLWDLADVEFDVLGASAVP
jgi:type VI secretion system protein ImpE